MKYFAFIDVNQTVNVIVPYKKKLALTPKSAKSGWFFKS